MLPLQCPPVFPGDEARGAARHIPEDTLSATLILNSYHFSQKTQLQSLTIIYKEYI